MFTNLKYSEYDFMFFFPVRNETLLFPRRRFLKTVMPMMNFILELQCEQLNVSYDSDCYPEGRCMLFS